MGVAAVVWLSACIPALAQVTPPTVAALPPERSAGLGADVPFLTYEAEHGLTDGEIVGPSRRFGDLAAEASGRRAVRLVAGESLQITLAAPADGLTLRVAVPDAPRCEDGDGALALSLDGETLATVALTPCFAWLYGDYPFTNDMTAGQGHRAFDHVRLRLPRVLPTGASIRLTPAGPQAWTAIDLIDAEVVPPAHTPPPDALDLSTLGADPTGARDSLAVFQSAVARGREQGRPLWIPPGRFRLDGPLVVDRVSIEGAGVWHSELVGDGVGLRGPDAEDGGGRDVALAHFAVVGNVRERDDRAPLNGVGGALGDSTVSDLWLQHLKVGVWIDGPADRLVLSRLRILDQTADGVNFHGGVTRSRMEHIFVRGSGDDGLAIWSHPTPNRDNVIARSTVIAPSLANGVAVYGGEDIRIEGVVVADSLTRGGGIHLGARFDATPFGGDISVQDALIVRSGSDDPAWRFGVGALWLYALDRPMLNAAISLRRLDIVDPTGPALMTLGQRIEGVAVEDVRLDPWATALDARAPGTLTLETDRPVNRFVDDVEIRRP